MLQTPKVKKRSFFLGQRERNKKNVDRRKKCDSENSESE